MTIAVLPRLSAIRAFLEEAVATVAQEYEVMVSTGRTEFDEQGLDRQRFQLVVVVGERGEDNELALDELLDSSGERSIKRAVESDRTVDHNAVDTRVLATSGARGFAGDPVRIGAEWTIEVLLEG